jgi:peptidyl-tRNA hydrolase
MKTAHILTVALLSLGLGVTACKKDESATENVKDAFNMREHEKLKDAGEDAKEAVQGAAEGVKEETREATDGK